MDWLWGLAWTPITDTAKRADRSWLAAHLGYRDGLGKKYVMASSRQRRRNYDTNRTGSDWALDTTELSCLSYIHSCRDRGWHSIAWRIQ